MKGNIKLVVVYLLRSREQIYDYGEAQTQMYCSTELNTNNVVTKKRETVVRLRLWICTTDDFNCPIIL